MATVASVLNKGVGKGKGKGRGKGGIGHPAMPTKDAGAPMGKGMSKGTSVAPKDAVKMMSKC